MIEAPSFYPVARDASGSPVHIDNWQLGVEVTCFGCGHDLVGHLPSYGIKPTAHFAHKAEATCSADTALYEASKAAILGAHAKGSLRELSWECPLCRRTRNVTELRSLTLVTGAGTSADLVSDVLASDSLGASILAIEIVVTREIEDDKLDRYHELGLDVFSIHPSWILVSDLSRGQTSLAVAHRAGVIDASSCSGCDAIVREKREWVDQELSRRAMQWWDQWIGLWRSAGRELSAQTSADQAVMRQTEAREHTWWLRWTTIWSRLGVQIIDTWWISWRQLWLDLGAQYVRPFHWMQRWLDAWEAIGRQYAADGVDRERKRRLDDDRRDVWWVKWIRMWKDIGQRESGATAAWKPICRTCRDDLRPDHICPRPDVAASA